MKKLLLVVLTLMVMVNFISAEVSKDYSTIAETKLTFEIDEFQIIEKDGFAQIKSAGDMAAVLKTGYPEVLKETAPIIVSPDMNMVIEVIGGTSYIVQLENDLIPSKGMLYRNVDPNSVPYNKADIYNENTFYPEITAQLSEPYIMRDIRGMTVSFNPFQYNPQTRELKVWKNIEVKIYEKGFSNKNTLSYEKSRKMSKEFMDLYSYRFLNYSDFSSKYTPIGETGNMLIISNDNFVDEMEPYVEWKRQKGIDVELVSLSDIGGNNKTNIQNKITTKYNNEGVTFILLIGDASEIAYQNGTQNATGSAPSDPTYVLLSGSDYHPEAFIGRFSAQTEADVTVQVNKNINYEKNPNSSADWYHKAIGIGSGEGAGSGDDGEADYQHQDNIRADLLGYGYTHVDQIYDYSSYPNSDTDVKNAVNAGRSVINYTGHGSQTSWSTTGFNNYDIDALSNGDMLPFVYSVACVNGEFHTGECFGEHWAKKSGGGAVAAFAASINQSWQPPMSAQDEFVDLLVAEAKLTLGGLCFNSEMQMLDDYSSAADMYETWHIFGDPSTQIRTKTPGTLTVTHDASISFGAASFAVTVNTSDAVCAVYKDGVLYGSAVSNSKGTANISLDPSISEAGDYTLTVTAFNKVPYITTIPAQAAASVTINPTSIPVNTTRSVTITVTDGGSGVSGVSVWAEGLGYTSAAAATNSSGQAVLSINYPYGPSLKIIGKESGASFNLFEEDLTITGASSLISPDVSVSTSYGLSGQLGINLPGTITASASTSGVELMTSVDGGTVVDHNSSSASVTPATYTAVKAYVVKTGYNYYEEDVTVIDPEGNLEGTVTAGGSAVSGAIVELFDSSKGLLHSVTTNASGYYSISEALICADYTLKVNKFGYNPYEDTFMLNYGTHTKNVSLTNAASSTISGTVSADGSGINGAAIEVYRKDTGDFVDETTTNSSGYYSIGLTNFTYTFKVFADGYTSVVQEVTVNGNATVNFTTEEFNGFASDFESDNGGLTSNNSEGWQWGTDSQTGAHSGSKVWGTVLNGDYPAAVSDFTLDLPEFSVGSDWIVTWYQWRAFEGSKSPKGDGGKTPFDGGNVKISTDGGASFTLLSDFFTDTNYPDYVTEETYGGIIASNYSNPIGGEQAFTSTTGGTWKRAAFDLSSFTGESVIIRLQFGSDTSINERGWYIDDVYLGPYQSNPDPEPEISVSPSSVSFGNVESGTTSGTESFTISNTGDAVLNVSGITAPTGFEINLGGTSTWGTSISSFTVSASGSKTVNVRFSPVSVQSYSGNIVVSSDDSDESSVNVAVSGTGTSAAEPEISVSPLSLNFGNVTAGEVSSFSTFTITNNGNAVLTVSGITAPAGFEIQYAAKGSALKKEVILRNDKWSSSLSGFTLPASASKQVEVRFTPSAVQTYSGNAVISSDDADESTVNVSLYGVGTAVPEPEISVSPLSLNFGNVTAGEVSSFSTFTITNNGNAVLTVSGITAPAGFEIQYAAKGSALIKNNEKWSSSLSGFTLPASSSKQVEVRFTPSAVQSYSGNAVISSDDADESTVNVSLSGTGTAVPEPEINVTPTNLSFGDVLIETYSLVKSFSIENIGNGTLTVNSISAPAGFEIKRSTGSVWGSSISSFTVSGSGSETINVRFSPDAVQTYSGNIVITSDDDNEGTVNVSVTGNGYDNSTGDPFGDPVIYPNNPMTIYAKVFIDGEPAGSGDIAAAFAGTELRGKHEVVISEGQAYVTMTVQVNANDEELNFKVWDSSAGTVQDANETALTVIGGTLGSYPDGLFLINVGTNQATQNVPFDSGWNLFSLNVELADMSPGSVFAGILDHIVQIKSTDAVYNPDMPDHMNTLQALVPGTAYFVETDASVSLEVTGEAVNVSTNNIELSAGWNMVGYTLQSSLDVETALSGIMDYLVQVKNAASVYEPGLPDFLNTLSSLIPGEGYWIKVSENCTLTYPSSVKGTDINRSQIEVPYFGKPVILTNSMVLYGETEHKNGFIGAYSDNELRGVSEITDGKFALVINSEEHEEINFVIWTGNESIEINEVLTSVPGGTAGDPQSDEFMKFTGSLEHNSELPAAFTSKISPNPFNPVTNIQFTLPAAADVRIFVYNANGQRVDTIDLGGKDAGYHSLSWDADKYVSGVYFMRITAGQETIINKMVLMK